MRASLVLVAATLVVATVTCMGRDPATEATVTSASQGATMTGTGATGGSTPETDMLGTGRAARPVTPPRAASPPPIVAPPPAVEPPAVEPAPVAPPAVEPLASDAGAPVEPAADQ
jgi:hypothetical protein